MIRSLVTLYTALGVTFFVVTLAMVLAIRQASR